MFTSATITVPVAEVEAIEKYVAKMNRLGAKFATPATFTLDVDWASRRFEDAVRINERIDGEAEVFEVDVVDVRLEGEAAFVVDGWSFVGTVSNDGVVTGNVAKDLWGVDLHRCDDCGAKHLRNQVFVLQNGDATKVVGGDCVRKYSGLLTPQALAALINWQVEFVGYDIANDDEEDLITAGADRYVQIARYMTYVVADVKRRGYVSAQTARDTDRMKTSFSAWLDMNSPDEAAHIAARVVRSEAAAVIEWAKQRFTFETAQTAYEHTMATLFAAGQFTKKRMGYVASAIAAYNVAMAEPKSDVAPAHLWNVGDIVSLNGVVRKVIAVEGYYGTSYVTIMEVEGQTVKFFGSKELVEGLPYTFEKTEVVEHSEYNGRPQTVVKINLRLKVNREMVESRRAAHNAAKAALAAA